MMNLRKGIADMAMFEYGKYKIDIDEEKTEKLFNEEKIEDTQDNRNFQKYVAERMTDEERALFESLHIDLSKVNIVCGNLSKNKKWWCSAILYISGHFISYPDTAFVTIDEEMEKGFELLGHTADNDIIIGNFQIHIFTPEEYFKEFYHKSDDIVENSIYLTIVAENLPWLLKEKCKRKEYKEYSDFLIKLRFHLRFIHYIHIPNIIRKRKELKMEQKKLVEELEMLKAKINIEYEILSDKETNTYRKEWVNRILPENASKEVREKAYKICLPNKQYCTFLWHMFSFDLVKTIENPTEEFNKLRKKDCTLIFEANKFLP